MAKIPRRRDAGFGVTDYVRYKPSAPPIAPLGLADYSAVTDALDKGARYAGERYRQEQDLEARAYTDNFINNTDLLMTKQLDDFGREGSTSTDEAVQKNREAWELALTGSYDAKRVANMPATRRQEFDEKLNYFKTKYEASLRKKKTEMIVSQVRATHHRDNVGYIALVGDPRVDLDQTLTKHGDHYSARLAAARAGGKVETVLQVQEAFQNSLKDMGEAIVGRFTDEIVKKATQGFIKGEGDLKHSWQKDNSLMNGKYASYYDLIVAIDEGAFAKYFTHTTKMAVIARLNKSLYSTLKMVKAGSVEAHKRNFYTEYGRLAEGARAGVTPTEDQIQHLRSLSESAGVLFTIDSERGLMDYSVKPTSRDSNLFDHFKRDVYHKMVYEAGVKGVPLQIGTVREELLKWAAGTNPYSSETHPRRLHGKFVDDMLETLKKEQLGQNKIVNDAGTDVLKNLFVHNKMGSKPKMVSDTRYLEFKKLNDYLGYDVSEAVRGYIEAKYREARANGEKFNVDKVQQDVLDLITKGVNSTGIDAARISIPEDDLRGAYARRTADLQNTGVEGYKASASAYDLMLIRLASVRLDRLKRVFGNEALMKKPSIAKVSAYTDFRILTESLKEKSLATRNQTLYGKGGEGQRHWYHVVEFTKSPYNTEALQKETGYYDAVRGKSAEESVDAVVSEKKPDATTQVTTDDGAGSPALDEKEMSPEVKEETEERKAEMEAGEGEEVGAIPDLSTEVESGKFPALTNKVLGQTADGRNIYANERDTEGYDSESSERAFHFQHTDGKWYSYPTIFNGEEISPADAYKLFVENGGVDPESGTVSPAFDDEQGVLDYMTERSEHLSDHLHPWKGVEKLRKEGSPYEAVVSGLSSLYEGSDIQKANLTLKVVRDALTNIVKGVASGGLSAAWSTIKGLYDKADGSIDRLADSLAGYLQKKLEHRERGEGEYEPEGPEEEAFEEMIMELESGASGEEELVDEGPQIEEPTLGGGSLSKVDERSADDIFNDARAGFIVNGKLDEKAYVAALEELLEQAVEDSIETGNNNPALAIIRELNKYRGE